MLSASLPPDVFLGKGVLKICSKFTEEHPCRGVISIKLLCKLIEITLPHEFSPVKLMHVSRATFYKNTSGGLLLKSHDKSFHTILLSLANHLDNVILVLKI